MFRVEGNLFCLRHIKSRYLLKYLTGNVKYADGQKTLELSTGFDLVFGELST